MERCLYTGWDDSNHAGDRKADIIVVTFSFEHKDSIVKKITNKRY